MTLDNADFAEPLALLWDAVLSREPQRIQSAFCTLDLAAQNALNTHLQKMAAEEGWHPEQQISARVALEVIRELKP